LLQHQSLYSKQIGLLLAAYQFIDLQHISLAMARNSGKLGYNMEGSSQQYIQWDHSVRQGSIGESSFSGGQNSVQEVRSPSM
jgi:hypothetical protein